MKYTFFSFLLVLALGLQSCSPFSVKTDYSERTDFTKMKTYLIRSEELKMNDIDKERILNEVSRNLKSKGMTPSSSPDVIVNVIAYHKKINSVTCSPGGFYGWGGPYGWGVGMNRTWNRNYTEGTLLIDIIDARTRKLIWQGEVSGINVDNRNSKVKEIPMVVDAIFSKYPPKK